MIFIITPAFKKVKYKFQYSKKLSQWACCDGPLTWSWNSFKNWEKKEKYFKIQNFKNFWFFNFWSIFLQFFLYKFIFSKPNLIFWLNLDIISHLTCKKKEKNRDFWIIFHFQLIFSWFWLKTQKCQFLKNFPEIFFNSFRFLTEIVPDFQKL